MRPFAHSLVAAVLVAFVGACGGGDGADLSSGRGGATSTSSVPPDGSVTTAPTTEPTGPSGGPGTTRPSAPAPTEPAPAPTSPPPPPPRSGLADVQIRLTRIAGFNQPMAMAVRGGDNGFYIAEKGGRVRAYRGNGVDPGSVIDVSGDVSTGTEQGLLGLAFSPDGSRLYLNYTDTGGDTRVVEYAMNGNQADPGSRREVLSIDQPAPNHNGGNLVFGPDGRLWIGTGDGGGAGDPQDNAQNVGSLLGKLLRIDPRPDVGSPYTVPADNPFVGMTSARPEIWAFGLLNPWRYSFDRATGDLWIGDIGQNAREEIDFVPAGSRGGQNFGWARLEGTRLYSGAAPSNAVPPLIDYNRAGGNCAITGGYVYRGGKISGLVGAYLYADYCLGQIQALRQSGGQVVDQRAFSATTRLLTSFGQDGAGELYVLSQEGGLFRIDPA